MDSQRRRKVVDRPFERHLVRIGEWMLARLSNRNTVHNPVEEYLRHLADYLYWADRRAAEDTIEEIRQHLAASCSDLIEQGFSVNLASEVAVARFGSYSKIGPDLARQLAPDTLQTKIYSGLMISRYLKTIAVTIAIQQFFESQLVWTSYIGVVITACTAGMLVNAIEHLRRVSIKPRLIINLRVLSHDLKREFYRAKLQGIWRFLSLSPYAYLVFLLLSGVWSIHAHLYAIGCFLFLESVEYVLFKVSAAKIARSVQA